MINSLQGRVEKLKHMFKSSAEPDATLVILNAGYNGDTSYLTVEGDDVLTEDVKGFLLKSGYEQLKPHHSTTFYVRNTKEHKLDSKFYPRDIS